MLEAPAIARDTPISSGRSTNTQAQPETNRHHPSNSRLYALDALRLVAALAVAFYHFLAVNNTKSPWGQPGHTIFPHAGFIAPYGWLGVEVFFMISGFVICMSCWGKSVGQFFISRVARLYPAYWLGVCLTFVFLLLTPELFSAPSVSHGIINLTMLEDPLGVPRLDPSYWTLWAEMRFYILLAIVAHWGLSYKRVTVFGFTWTIVASIAKTADWKFLDVVAMPKYAPYFLVGIGLYLIYRFGHHLMTWLLIGVNLALSYDQAVFRMRYQSAHVQHVQLSQWPVAVILLLSFGILLATATGHMNWVRWRWITVAGALTYPFYLLHQQIGYSVIHFLYEKLNLSAYIVFPGTLILLLILSWLVYRFVEAPGAQVLKRGLKSASSLS